MTAWRVTYYHANGRHMGPDTDMFYTDKERAFKCGLICTKDVEGTTFKVDEISIAS